ncbi:MAG TPA: hypothetical protein VFH63_11650 [candidate division Zixibacteria bacterium]|nr:hypothetical protein [candidate division Zixibacteria bacterium]
MITRLGAAVLIGAAVSALLVPTSGAGERCFSLLAFQVPCEGWIAALAGIGTAVVLGVALLVAGRQAT